MEKNARKGNKNSKWNEKCAIKVWQRLFVLYIHCLNLKWENIYAFCQYKISETLNWRCINSNDGKKFNIFYQNETNTRALHSSAWKFIQWTKKKSINPFKFIQFTYYILLCILDLHINLIFLRSVICRSAYLHTQQNRIKIHNVKNILFRIPFLFKNFSPFYFHFCQLMLFYIILCWMADAGCIF